MNRWGLCLGTMLLGGATLLLLGGCTEVRDRQYAKAIAVAHTPDATSWQAVLCCHPTTEQATAQPTVSAEAVSLLPERLQAQMGPALYMGHLSTLLVSGQDLQDAAGTALLEWGLQTHWLPPDCGVLDTLTTSACAVLSEQPEADWEAMRNAAVASAQIPSRRLADCVGDDWNGSGVTLLPCLQNTQGTPSFALSVRDASGLLGVLSERACRGLALLGGDWKRCVLPILQTDANGNRQCAAAELRICKAFVSVVERTDARLELRLHLRWDAPLPSGGFCTKAEWQSLCATTLTDTLIAALEESAVRYGADCCYLRESALQNGVALAKTATQPEWRAALQAATITVASCTQTDAPFGWG